MRMEFATLEELEESGAIFLYYTDMGVIGELQKRTNELKVQKKNVTKTKNVLCQIYTEIQTGRMYLSMNNKTTFLKKDSKTFSIEKAIEKINFMNKRGKYLWKIETL